MPACLSDEGRLQAQRAGAALAAHGHSFDVVYTSVLRRAIHTMWLAVDAMDMMYVQGGLMAIFVLCV